MAVQSLRERSKARRHAAIEQAALRLFAERGYDATTIADIAAEAEVAPRTVTLYFPTKADLALAHSNAAAERLTAAFTARAPGETMLEVLDRWLLTEATTLDPEIVRLSAGLFTQNPALLAMQQLAIRKALDVGVRAMADDLGVEMDHLLTSIIGSAAGSLVTTYMAAVLVDGEDIQKVHDTVMRFLRAGIDAVIQGR